MILGGPNNTVAVELSNYIVMIEAPQNEQRALAFIAEARRQIPNKPSRYVINTHHHFDHSGGLRAFADEEATIVKHALNAGFYERISDAPRTLTPDRLFQSGKTSIFDTLTEMNVLTDGTRTIKMPLVQDSPHCDGIIMAYLPEERMLVEADIFDSPGPGVPGVTEGIPTVADLVDNIERVELDVR